MYRWCYLWETRSRLCKSVSSNKYSNTRRTGSAPYWMAQYEGSVEDVTTSRVWGVLRKLSMEWHTCEQCLRLHNTSYRVLKEEFLLFTSDHCMLAGMNFLSLVWQLTYFCVFSEVISLKWWYHHNIIRYKSWTFFKCSVLLVFITALVNCGYPKKAICVQKESFRQCIKSFR